MKFPIDVASRVSRELSTTLDRIAGNPDREGVPTLDDARAIVAMRAGEADRRDETMHPQLSASMLDEIDGLIAEFGGEAPVADFVASTASEPLSRLIEAAAGEPPARRRSTLGSVRDAMAAGLTERLVGDGDIEPDEDQTLLAEIDGLIDRYGRDAAAETFVRYE